MEQTIPIVDWSALSCFETLRFDGGDGGLITKAGILPFYYDVASKSYQFLIAAPKPVRNPDDVVPFAMARGTRRMQALGDDRWVDIRDDGAKALVMAGDAQAESLYITALQEAEEELGVTENHVATLFDCGVMTYKDYGIHWFAAELTRPNGLLDAVDSAGVCWVSCSEIEQMVDEAVFNANYQALFFSISGAVDVFFVPK